MSRAARRIKDNVRQSHLTYIWQAAHGLEMDQPERVARIVRDFLERGEGFLVPRKVA